MGKRGFILANNALFVSVDLIGEKNQVILEFHITGQKLTFKTYNYRHCDTSMSPKTADYFPSGGVIAMFLGNCKVLCYANMNVTSFRVSANQISVFSITQQSR